MPHTWFEVKGNIRKRVALPPKTGAGTVVQVPMLAYGDSREWVRLSMGGR